MAANVVYGKRDLVVEALAQKIRSGALAPGQRLEGEHRLAEEFDVSRGTIRQALSELARQELIATQSGIGSFVTFDDKPLDQRLGWAQALSDADAQIVTRVLAIATVAPDDAPDLPAIVPGGPLVAVRRTRELTRPELPDVVSFENAFVPATGVLRDLPRTGLRDGSLSASLAAAGLRPARGEQRAALHRLTRDEARVLRREPGDAFLRTARTSFTSDGRFVEHVVSLLDPDHFQLHYTFGDQR
ncbi:GntR family transcriptional regulator [Cellulosimicrobium arenosum]|uniref:GntR family transcriptional regulator n=1 Tax=Cellulosimicrobium arenosum TaxID=2708133 RepID=A0A927J101_9MICO|nr:GntR family transcriptional regulator [Cellulosimicrobium arenosum]MBD8079899.1 GntR family transcriptional regulator [Cellulosimicrobium arenosum]